MREFDLQGWVREFHEAFGLPAPRFTVPLTAEEMAIRIAFMESEMEEFFAAKAVVDRLDALLDLAYFAVGNTVMSGFPLAPFRTDEMARSRTFHDISTEIAFLGDAVEAAHQAYASVKIAVICLSIVSQHGPVDEMMKAVHEANMRKLWPDGKPRYRDGDGKVVKPPGWYGPEAELEKLMYER